MEELIKKHLGINTPQWIIDNCKALLIEWDSLKVDTSERQLTIPDVSKSVYSKCGCGGNMIPTEDGLVCDICG